LITSSGSAITEVTGKEAEISRFSSASASCFVGSLSQPLTAEEILQCYIQTYTTVPTTVTQLLSYAKSKHWDLKYTHAKNLIGCNNNHQNKNTYSSDLLRKTKSEEYSSSVLKQMENKKKNHHQLN